MYNEMSSRRLLVDSYKMELIRLCRCLTILLAIWLALRNFLM